MKKSTYLPPMIFMYLWGMFLFVFSGAAVQEPTIMKKVREMYNAKTSLETKFDLRIFWKVREKEEAKSGKIVLAPGDKFKVELGPALWVSNGETYWESEKDDHGTQVVIKRLADVNIAMHPSHVLSRYVGDYSYRLKEEKDGIAVVEWMADSLSNQSEAKVIRLSIDKKSGKITTLFVIDKSGNESTYAFKKTKFTAHAPEKMFDFAPPQGASIIDMRN